VSNINLLFYKLVIWLVNQKIANIIEGYTLSKPAQRTFDLKLCLGVFFLEDIEMIGLMRRAKARASEMDEAVIVNMVSAKCISTAWLLQAIV
jgi:hypothetical protein